MAKNGYDQTYEDDRRENEETKDLPRRAMKAITPDFAKPALKYISGSELDTDKVKRNTGETTDAMGNSYKKGGKIMEHKHNMDHVKQHAAGHMHEQEKVAKHYGSEGHKMHHEHVKAMCMGGKSTAK